MKKIIIIYLFVICSISCDKFLEEYSQNQVYAETAQDLNELLVGNCFMLTILKTAPYSQDNISLDNNNMNYPWLSVMDDDSEVFLVNEIALSYNTPRNVFSPFHYWSSEPFSTLENKQYNDKEWEKFYKHIAVLNSIIFQAGELRSKEDDIELLNKVEGEARFLRAGYYFLLVNIYGKPYNKATANIDGGVPLKISEVIEDKYYSRDAVGQVYTQIVDDLQQAAVRLENIKQTSTLRVGTHAVNALLSRVYLYMEEYELAIEAADKVLAGSYTIPDLNNWSENENVIYRNSPETIFTQGGNTINAVFLNDSLSLYNGDDNRASSFKVSDDLKDCYDINDLRRLAFFRITIKTKSSLPNKYKSWDYVSNDTEQVADFLIRLSEVILNKAEGLAMLNRDAEAKIELEKIRTKRFKPEHLTTVTETGEDLVNFIRNERRRELCFEGHRWFDLRRYSVNSIYPLPDSFTIKHANYSYEAFMQEWHEDGYYELESYKKDEAAWTVPIPNYAIEFNRGALTNEIRQQRSVKRN